MRRQQGFAIAVVLLVSIVALVAATTAASLAGLGARRVSTQELRTTSALLAAESGLNTVVARSRSPEYAFASAASVSAWLADSDLDVHTLPGGSSFSLSVLGDETGPTVTLRSVGTSPDGSVAVILQDYAFPTGTVDLSLFANAALITQGTLSTNSANSLLIGRDDDPDSWVFADRTLREGLAGEYFIVAPGTADEELVQIREDADGDLIACTADFDGDGTDDAGISVRVVDGGTNDCLAPATAGSLIPFAVTSDVTVPTTTTFQVTDVSVYADGNAIKIADVDGADWVGTISDIDGDEVTVTWDQFGTGGTLAEGTPIRRIVPSAIVGDQAGCPTGPKIGEKLPQGCVEDDLSNLWDKTFPELSKEQMLGIAQCNSTILGLLGMDSSTCEDGYYGPEADLEWPNVTLSGVTWIDGANTGNFNSRGGGKSTDTDSRALCGEGVVILNTGVYAVDDSSSSINLNVSDCEFSGVLYVIGDVRIQGNLDSFSGTIIVETAEGTSIQGTGTKALYDPIAIRRALANLPGGSERDGFLGALPVTWRFGPDAGTE